MSHSLDQSRPHSLLEELATVADSTQHQLAVFNDTLAEVDSLTTLGQRSLRLFARVAFLGGMAGGAAELGGAGQTMKASATWAAASVLVGLLGAAVCAVIGHWATVGLSRRRLLWDRFVRWILKSRFPQTELGLPGVRRQWARGAEQR